MASARVKLVRGAAIAVILGQCLGGQALAEAKQGTKAGDLNSNLLVLNLFAKQPRAVNDAYRMAYKVLAAERTASYADLAADAAFQEHCRAHGITHLGGPMLGSVTANGVSVWVRTLAPAAVTVMVEIDGGKRTFGPVRSSAATDMAAVVPVDGLQPGTRYSYSVFVDGEPITMPATATITTAPAASGDSRVRIAFGSCLHRWGVGNQAQAAQIRQREPTALLLLGDIAVQDRNNDLGMHRADYLLRDLFPAWRELSASVPVYATWDDHDYFDNDKAGIPRRYSERDKQDVCDVFRQAWNNPGYGFNDERRGVFMRTRLGPCDVIMVDNRYFRENKDGSFLGDGQMRWLEAQLLDCKGPFIVLSCGSMWSDYVSNGKDSWGRWDPEGRERILTLIEKHKIPGVIFISGDRHGARGFRIPRPSGFEFYEFEAASLGGRHGPPIRMPGWTTQLYGIADRYAFGELTMDAALPDPEATFRLVGDDGEIIYELMLKRSQLTPK